MVVQNPDPQGFDRLVPQLESFVERLCLPSWRVPRHHFAYQVRVRRAAELLSTGGFNVSEVADRCGFGDVFPFGKVFRRVAGRPPRELLRG